MFSHFARKLRSLGSAVDSGSFLAGSSRWFPAPGCESIVRDIALSLEESQRPVKENLQRTISILDRSEGRFYLKRCRVNTPRTWVREILRLPKAQLEFENALELRKRGFGGIEPLAWGRVEARGPSESWLLTREAPNAVEFDAAVSRLSVEQRWRFAREFGAYFGRLHEAGLSHPDPHTGNFLVQFGEGIPEFIALDVHALRFGKPLKWSEAKANLVLLNRGNTLRDNTDRFRFLKGYCAERPEFEPFEILPELDAATMRSNFRFWSRRTKRYLGKNRQFAPFQAPGLRGHAVNDLPSEWREAWMNDPDAPFRDPSATPLKDSPSSTVVRLESILFKRFRIKSWNALLKNGLRRSPAMRSWILGHGLLDRGLPTARPLFVAERVRFGIPREGYIAFEFIPNAVELPKAVERANPEQVKGLAEKLGRLLHTMHERRVRHRDLKASNILIRLPELEPVLIDLVGVTADWDVSDLARMSDLARLSASFVNSPSIRHSLRLRFLYAYLGYRTVEDEEELKIWWVIIQSETEAKVAKNARSGRPLA